MAFVGRAMDIDVKKVMLTLLERQKEYVVEDREDYSEGMVAVFLVDGSSYVTFPEFEDEESKIAAYSAIGRRWRRTVLSERQYTCCRTRRRHADDGSC